MLYKHYRKAGSLAEAIDLLSHKNGGQVRLVAGGTDLMLQLHERILAADTLIDISRVPELHGVREENGRIVIGAATPYAEIARSPVIRQHAPLLVQASKQVGAAQIQNMATLGGNLGNASPAADGIPPLYALEAEVVVRGLGGERHIPIEEFHQGYRKIDLLPGELIQEVRFPKPPEGTRTAFYKYALRKSQAIAVVNAAVVLRAENGAIEFARVALGSVAPTAIRSRQAEQALAGQTPGEETFQQAGEAARLDAAPISDIRGSASFRRYLVGVSVVQALRTAWERTPSTEETH